MIAIEVHNISKEYRIYRKPRHWLIEKLSFGKIRRARIVAALRDISLTIEHGQSFGIIGANGSGKSTLLKIITGLLQPTGGRVDVRGQVAAFLELGSGFHPEFTGRQNIKLNCAIMGMSSKETARLIGEIAAFSELGEAIDDPVRTYSSGMFMRLGFSVAAHINPEILVVDEVLSVGDEYFMGKCIDRLNEFKRQGRTIVMVSHDLGLVRRLCDKVALLKAGEVIAQGAPDDVADSYLRQIYEEAANKSLRACADLSSLGLKDAIRRGTREIEITRVELFDHDGKPSRLLETGRGLRIEMDYVVHEPISKALFGFNIFRNDGVLLVSANQDVGPDKVAHPPLDKGAKGRVIFNCESLPLLGGDYSLGFSIFKGDVALPTPIDEILGAITFKVFAGSHRDKGLWSLSGQWKFE